MWANHHYLEFVLNWVHHLRLLGLVGAMDAALLQASLCLSAVLSAPLGASLTPPGPQLPPGGRHVGLALLQ